MALVRAASMLMHLSHFGLYAFFPTFAARGEWLATSNCNATSMPFASLRANAVALLILRYGFLTKAILQLG